MQSKLDGQRLKHIANAAGEAEARDTANRANLTAFERSLRAPDLSGNPRYAQSSLSKYIDMMKEMGYSYSEILKRI